MANGLEAEEDRDVVQQDRRASHAQASTRDGDEPMPDVTDDAGQFMLLTSLQVFAKIGSTAGFFFNAVQRILSIVAVVSFQYLVNTLLQQCGWQLHRHCICNLAIPKFLLSHPASQGCSCDTCAF